MVNWRIVAKETQSKYGIWIRPAHFRWGKMVIIDQIRVTSTNKISAAANKLFLSPNWIGVKAKLKIRFRINGRAIMNGISFRQASKNTLPKEMAIKI